MSQRQIEVLRLGHRPQRDKRITTHVCLTARALGARRVWLTRRDRALERSVGTVVERFGGPFELDVTASWRSTVTSFPGSSVHLTMYGEPFRDVVDRLDADEPLLVVVGAEKVPAELFQLATYNAAVGNQPHSEVAALALLLEAVGGHEALERRFEGAEVDIEPSPRGKRVRRRS